MKQMSVFTLYAALSICFFSVSCKKEKGQPATDASCRIITSLGGPDTYHFTYNADGKVSSFLVAPTNQKSTYAYEENKTTVLFEINGNFHSKRIITNNSLGFTTNIRREANKMGTVWNNQSVEYNGTRLVKILYTSSDPNQAPFAVSYTWKDGNIASMETGGAVITYEYYTDRLSAPGEWRRFIELMDGYRLYDNKNLTKSMKKGSEITNFKYEFDADGKITKTTIIEPDNAVSSSQYEYACN